MKVMSIHNQLLQEKVTCHHVTSNCQGRTRDCCRSHGVTVGSGRTDHATHIWRWSRCYEIGLRCARRRRSSCHSQPSVNAESHLSIGIGEDLTASPSRTTMRSCRPERSLTGLQRLLVHFRIPIYVPSAFLIFDYFRMLCQESVYEKCEFRNIIRFHLLPFPLECT